MPDTLDELRSALPDRYVIQRELGRGGMATVYLAFDEKQKRKVAIKVLRPELAASIGVQRFLREIELTAQLVHPHILPLLESGKADDILYYVMPYVEGETLRDRLRREGQLPFEDAVKTTSEVAEALAYAHSLGVIHRDIKPENIFLAAGHAVIGDFGIARAISAAGGERLTETGLAMGTPAYMSPEQATGSSTIDHRTDIYSLGCVLYEMLGGDPPFSGSTPRSILARKVTDQIPSLRSVRETVPEAIENVVLKALARAPADRFTTAAQLVKALQDPATVTPVRTRAVRVRSVAIGGGAIVALVVVIVVGWQLTVSRVGGRPDYSRQGMPIAVLPCDNLSASDVQPYYSDAIAREINLRMHKLGGFSVKGHHSAQRVLDPAKSYGEMASELDADYIVACGVGMSNGLVEIHASLIDPETGAQLWAEIYDSINSSSVGAVTGVEADIVRQVASTLNVLVMPEEQRRLAQVPTDNAEAYDAYLRANQYWTGFELLLTDRRRAIGQYERAVQLDPDFTEAHARLSMQYTGLSFIPGEAERALPLAARHAERALQLDPQLPVGHLAKALYLQESFADTASVLPELTMALNADSNSGEILWRAADIYGRELGDWERALSYSQRALELDPLNADRHFEVGYADFALRRHSEAVPYINRAIELVPGNYIYYSILAWVYLSWQGDIHRASEVLQTAVHMTGRERAVARFMRTHWRVSRVLAVDDWYRGVLEATSLGPPDIDSADYYGHKAALYEGLHNRERARVYYDSLARVLEARPPERSPMMVARHHEQLGFAYAGLGNKESAIREGLKALEPMRDRPFPTVTRIIMLFDIYAMVGEYNDALERLRWLLSVPNYVTPNWLALDPALAALREMPAYKELVAAY